jgi:hypothetical protein
MHLKDLKHSYGPRSPPPRHIFNAPRSCEARSDQEQSALMMRTMGFDPGKSKADFEQSLADLELTL